MFSLRYAHTSGGRVWHVNYGAILVFLSIHKLTRALARTFEESFITKYDHKDRAIRL